jgi:nucleoside-diphosphate-sugar epimerase
MVRPTSRCELLDDLDVEICQADLLDPGSLRVALEDVDVVVHTAAHLGDWCDEEQSRAVNVGGVKNLIAAANEHGRLQRFVHISSLGVYEARHHFQTDETTPPDENGIDAYTRTKAAAEAVLQTARAENDFPFVILRPGFIYGPGDRHVVPRVVETVSTGQMQLIGDGQKVLNNTCVGNLAAAIMLAIENDQAVGEVFNIRDKRLVTRVEFIGTIADYLNKPMPGHVPEWLARAAVGVFENTAKLLRKKSAPRLTKTRFKFMTLNLDFSTAKAERILGYQPQVDFKEGMHEALDWLAQEGQLTKSVDAAKQAGASSESTASSPSTHQVQ